MDQIKPWNGQTPIELATRKKKASSRWSEAYKRKAKQRKAQKREEHDSTYERNRAAFEAFMKIDK